jgi:hypothetical protein
MYPHFVFGMEYARGTDFGKNFVVVLGQSLYPYFLEVNSLEVQSCQQIGFYVALPDGNDRRIEPAQIELL